MLELETVVGQTGVPQQQTVLTTIVGALDIPAKNIVNEYSAMTVPSFWSAVRFIAETLASLPKYVVLDDGDTRTRTKHDLNKILRRAINGFSRPFQVFETLYHHATVWGNGYLLILRDDLGKPTGLVNVSPELVIPFVFEGQRWFYLGIETNNPAENYIPDADMIHIAMIGYDGVRGYPPVHLMKQSLDIAKATETHSANYFKNGSMIRGSIEFPGALTDDQIKSIKDSARLFRGTQSSDALAAMILPFGGHLNNSTVPNETSQLIETRKFSIIEVCQTLRVPPHVVYMLERGTYNNVEQMSIDVIKFSLGAWIVKTEQELSAKLFTESEQDAGFEVCFDVDGLLRGDSAAQSKYVIDLVNNGLALPNWGARRLGLPDLGAEGDRLRIPVSQSQPQPLSPDPTPTPEPEQKEPPQDTTAPDYSAVIEPLVLEACQRVDSKTNKAFERRGDKLDEQWLSKFADEQADYALAALSPIAVAAGALGFTVNVPAIADSYGNSLKAKEKVSLSDLAKREFNV